jgi:hypothetical protein
MVITVRNFSCKFGEVMAKGIQVTERWVFEHGTLSERRKYAICLARSHIVSFKKNMTFFQRNQFKSHFNYYQCSCDLIMFEFINLKRWYIYFISKSKFETRKLEGCVQVELLIISSASWAFQFVIFLETFLFVSRPSFKTAEVLCYR